MIAEGHQDIEIRCRRDRTSRRNSARDASTGRSVRRPRGAEATIIAYAPRTPDGRRFAAELIRCPADAAGSAPHHGIEIVSSDRTGRSTREQPCHGEQDDNYQAITPAALRRRSPTPSQRRADAKPSVAAATSRESWCDGCHASITNSGFVDRARRKARRPRVGEHEHDDDEHDQAWPARVLISAPLHKQPADSSG